MLLFEISEILLKSDLLLTVARIHFLPSGFIIFNNFSNETQ